MIMEITFYQLVYPKNYVPGMGYKKIFLGKTWFSELQRGIIGTENMLWRCAARLKITARANSFRVSDYVKKDVWFCGSFP